MELIDQPEPTLCPVTSGGHTSPQQKPMYRSAYVAECGGPVLGRWRARRAVAARTWVQVPAGPPTAASLDAFAGVRVARSGVVVRRSEDGRVRHLGQSADSTEAVPISWLLDDAMTHVNMDFPSAVRDVMAGREDRDEFDVEQVVRLSLTSLGRAVTHGLVWLEPVGT